MPFGGFLAFDSEFIYFYPNGSNQCLDARKLRRSMVVSAITQVDPYNPEDQSGFLRYLIGTEGGEIYMIAFQIEILREITKDGTRSLSQVNPDSAKL